MANDRHSYVEFYPSDWIAGTAYMPVAVEWLYLQICLYNWDKREPLPPAQASLRLSRSPSWQDDLTMLLDAGKVIKTAGGGLFVERALVAANKAYDLWEKKSRGGRARQASGNAGKDEQSSKTAGSTPDRTATANQNQNQNQTPPIGGDPPAPLGGDDGGDAGDLVFSVPASAMKAFREHRTKLKHPMTKRAEELIVGKLEKIWTERGHDPAAVIDQSIVEGWRGVFPLKDEGNGRGQGSGTGRRATPDRRDGFTRAIHGEVFPGGQPPGDEG